MDQGRSDTTPAASGTVRRYPDGGVITPLNAVREDKSRRTELADPLLALAPPMYMADLSGRLIVTNPAFDRLAARMPDGGTDKIPGELTAVFDRLRQGEREIEERVTMRGDGAEVHYRARHFRTVASDGRLVFAGMYTDVTQEIQALRSARRTEARFRDLIRSTSDWVWEADADLNLTYISSRITEALGKPPSALKGKNLFSFGRFEGDPAEPMQPGELGRAMSPFRQRVFLMPDRNGKVRRIALSGVPVFDETTGGFAGYRGTGTDVTRRHDAEERLRQSQHRLEASLKALRERNLQLDHALTEARSASVAKTEFLGKMSHELRTPLNAIIGFSEMSVRQMFGPLGAHYLEYFRDIGGAAEHLLQIIEDILDAVNVEANKINVQIQPVRIGNIIDEAKSIVMGRAAQRGVNLSEVVEPEGWIVKGDPGRVRQIFVNLLNNAVKFTDAGDSVGVDTEPGEPGMLDITVWDTGIGIPVDQHEKIFESFHQVSANVMSQPREGTGLGLAISRQLAQLMDGEIFVDSTPGRGSRFTVRLPLAAESPNS